MKEKEGSQFKEYGGGELGAETGPSKEGLQDILFSFFNCVKLLSWSRGSSCLKDGWPLWSW